MVLEISKAEKKASLPRRFQRTFTGMKSWVSICNAYKLTSLCLLDCSGFVVGSGDVFLMNAAFV